MLDVVRSAARQRALAAAFDVEILSLATANPPFRLPQSEAAAYAKQLFPQLSKLWQLYDNNWDRVPVQLRTDRVVFKAA